MGDKRSGKSEGKREDKLIKIRTQHQKSTVTGMAVHGKHVFVVHWGHSTLYVYSKRGLLATADIPDLKSPWGMATMGSGDNTQLVITDSKYPYGLHWVSVAIQNGQCIVGSTRQQKLTFLPWGIYLDNTNNTLMIADPVSQKIQLYHSGKRPSVVSVSSEFKDMPHHVVPAIPQGGFVVCDNKTQLTWLDKDGGVVKEVKKGNDLINPCHIVTDKNGHVVVADYDGHAVMVYTNGAYTSHLLKQTNGIKCPTRLVLDEQSMNLWVSHGTQETGFELICINFPDSFEVASTKC